MTIDGRPPESAEVEVERLLAAWSSGDGDAFEALVPLVCDDIRDLAHHYLAREPAAATLQTTALVHEVYLRLLGRQTVRWKNRAHFFGSLANLMRRVLVDHARRRLAEKRGHGAFKVDLAEAMAAVARRPELVAVDDALENLAAVDPRKCRIVELRFFMGLTHEEIADVLGLSVRSVSREWQKARMWLQRELGDA